MSREATRSREGKPEAGGQRAGRGATSVATHCAEDASLPWGVCVCFRGTPPQVNKPHGASLGLTAYDKDRD